MPTFIVFPPAVVFYVTALGEGVGGEARGPIVRIRNKYIDDVGIRMHELEHVKQWWVIGLLASALPWAFYLAGLIQFNTAIYIQSIAWSTGSLLYLLVKPYKLWAELKAYAVQLRYSQEKVADTRLFGIFISENYGLKITADDASAKLKEMS